MQSNRLTQSSQWLANAVYDMEQFMSSRTPESVQECDDEALGQMLKEIRASSMRVAQLLSDQTMSFNKHTKACAFKLGHQDEETKAELREILAWVQHMSSWYMSSWTGAFGAKYESRTHSSLQRLLQTLSSDPVKKRSFAHNLTAHHGAANFFLESVVNKAIATLERREREAQCSEEFLDMNLSSKLEALIAAGMQIVNAATDEQRQWTETMNHIDMKVAALHQFANALHQFRNVWRSYCLFRLGEINEGKWLSLKTFFTRADAVKVHQNLEELRDAIIKESAIRQISAQWPPTDAMSVNSSDLATSSASFSGSDDSISSWIKVRSVGNDCCFLPDTLFRKSEDSFVKAGALTIGDEVLSANGRLLSVLDLKEHTEEMQKLVTLVTDTACLTVTASHRIMAFVDGRLKDVRAEALVEGDHVSCTKGPAKIGQLYSCELPTKVIEIAFQPDESVAAFLAPSNEIHSKGRRFKPKSRRAGMSRREQADVCSIPDTASSWSD